MSALMSPSASSTRELVCDSEYDTGSTRSSSSSTPTLKGAGDTYQACPTTLATLHVGTARDPTPSAPARVSPDHARGRRGAARAARDGGRDRPRLHRAHVGVAHAQ